MASTATSPTHLLLAFFFFLVVCAAPSASCTRTCHHLFGGLCCSFSLLYSHLPSPVICNELAALAAAAGRCMAAAARCNTTITAATPDPTAVTVRAAFTLITKREVLQVGCHAVQNLDGGLHSSLGRQQWSLRWRR